MKNGETEKVLYNGVLMGYVIKWKKQQYGFCTDRLLRAHSQSYWGNHKTKASAIEQCISANKDEYEYLQSAFKEDL